MVTSDAKITKDTVSAIALRQFWASRVGLLWPSRIALALGLGALSVAPWIAFARAEWARPAWTLFFAGGTLLVLRFTLYDTTEWRRRQRAWALDVPFAVEHLARAYADEPGLPKAG